MSNGKKTNGSRVRLTALGLLILLGQAVFTQRPTSPK